MLVFALVLDEEDPPHSTTPRIWVCVENTSIGAVLKCLFPVAPCVRPLLEYRLAPQYSSRLYIAAVGGHYVFAAC